MSPEAEIRSLFGRYLTAWNARDFEGVAACYSAPSLFILPSASVPVAGATAMVAMLQNLFAGLEADGFSHTEIDEIDVCPRGDTFATAEASGVRRLRRDGTEIEVIDAHYILRRGESGWQFVTAVTLPHKRSD